MSISGNFFSQKSTIGVIIAAIETNNDMYCLQKRIEKFPLIAILTRTKSQHEILFFIVISCFQTDTVHGRLDIS